MYKDVVHLEVFFVYSAAVAAVFFLNKQNRFSGCMSKLATEIKVSQVLLLFFIFDL